MARQIDWTLTLTLLTFAAAAITLILVAFATKYSKLSHLLQKRQE